MWGGGISRDDFQKGGNHNQKRCKALCMLRAGHRPKNIDIRVLESVQHSLNFEPII